MNSIHKSKVIARAIMQEAKDYISSVETTLNKIRNNHDAFELPSITRQDYTERKEQKINDFYKELNDIQDRINYIKEIYKESFEI